MAKQLTDVEIHATESESLIDKDDDNNEVSVDCIDDRLYLGNLVSARDVKTLEKLNITHILTVDLVPLTRSILERPNLTFKYVKLADVPKEDLISHLPSINAFIKKTLDEGGTVLVHCYFGVSRSAAVVIAYMMEKYGLCYEDAYTLVKSKRRFVHPNVGFIAQLRLFGHMGCQLNKEDPRYKQFRLKLAGQKLKQVKILPQIFANLVKSDPGLVRERPDPIVYRCKKCRRVVASQSNIIPHVPRQVKVELAKKGIRPPPSKLTGLNCAENGQILIEKLKSLACQIMDATTPEMHIDNTQIDTVENDTGEVSQQHRQLVATTSSGSEKQSSDGYSENLLDGHIVARADAPEVCRLMWFVEPMDWMKDVHSEAQGKLHCPKCYTKIGSFSWIMGCRCPCGQKVAPAFYLVPSKVEWSNIVQNVQITL
ncbi:Dual specificity protein phosphatase MPK-4 [Eumeta japonica]|uniref:Dual specificity protein phosphatase MPK-4 n=1 Tax=Eumeta variegata TaxID=151549 RepID=A0A4C1TTX0_EUMVA|nr:Dual specificity protein phosphatase MPK-4 [Eumeta japonica]